MQRPFVSMQRLRHAPAAAEERETHPLLGAFPLIVMTIATLLVLFALTMTWLNDAGEDALLHPQALVTAVTRASQDR